MIAQVKLTDGASAGNTPYVSADITPKAGRIIIASVTGNGSLADNASISGCNLTWIKIGSASYNNTTRTTVWRGISSAPTTGAITFTVPGAVNGVWAVAELTGVDITNPIVQVATATANSTGVTASLAAFGNAANATIGAGSGNSSGGNPISTGGGFTTISSQWAEQAAQILEFNAGNDTTVDIGRSGTGYLQIVGFEVRAWLSSIKTVDGLARASIKTIDGVPIEYVKTINGLQ